MDEDSERGPLTKKREEDDDEDSKKGSSAAVTDNYFFELIEMTYSDELSLERNSREIAKKILSKESSLLILIEGLGPKLTSKTVQDRAKAMDILSLVFDSLEKDFLTETELQFIVEFLVNRLNDQHLVVPKVMLCIYPIVQCQNLPKGAGARLLHQLFQQANVQSHVQKVRRNVFLTVEFLLKTRLDELMEMSSDFVINFLQAIDGEKDPRNLLLLFQIIPTVISNFSLGPFIEDFFEVLSCYFPVDFNPTVAVPGMEVITRESLAGALQICLSHTNQFSEFLIPLALEKLDSSLTDAKIDSLHLLEMCCERCYHPKDLQPFLPQIWHSLRTEIFMGGNELIERSAVDFLKAAFQVVSRDEGTLNTCIEMVFTECKHHLCEPELRLIHPTTKVVVGMCEASEKSCSAVAPRTLAILHEQLTHKSMDRERKVLLGIVDVILSTCRKYPTVNLSKLLPNWDEILATWFSFITNSDPDYATAVLGILLKTMGNELDFERKSRKLLQEHLLSLLDSGNIPDDELASIIEIAEQLSLTYGEEFIEISLPNLLNSVSARSSVNPVVAKSVQLKYKVLSESSHHNCTICEMVVTQVLSLILINPSEVDLHALKCLQRIVDKVCTSTDLRTSGSLVNAFVTSLSVMDRVYEVASHLGKSTPNLVCANGMGDGKQYFDEETLPAKPLEADTVTVVERQNKVIFLICVNIIRSLTGKCDEELQSSVVSRFWTSKINDAPLYSVIKEVPVSLVEAVLGPLRPSVEVYRRKELINYLIKDIMEPGSKDYISCCRLLAVFLNKIESDDDFSNLLKQIENEIHKGLESICHKSCEESSKKGNVDCSAGSGDGTWSVNEERNSESNIAIRIQMLAWVVKALAMRGIKELGQWMEKLLDLLNSETYGVFAVEGFKIILQDDHVSLNTQSHCKYRFLYKQRCFQMSVPKLVTGYRSTKSEQCKVNFIQALSCQLKHIPKEILAMDMESVFPLLVASLKLSSASPIVILSTLKAFVEVMNNADDEMEKRIVEYCHDIIPQLVRLAGFKDSMDVRIMALECLLKCAKCPTHVILPLKRSVVSDLQRCLDDSKRLVRTAARKTRNVWLLIDAPGGI